MQARHLRNAEGSSPGEIKTKVKYGSNDFCLMKRTKDTRWAQENIDTSKFPPLEISNNNNNFSSSPPPGRPVDQYSSNKRAASSSPPDFTKKPVKAPNNGVQANDSHRNCAANAVNEVIEINDSALIGVDNSEASDNSETQKEAVNYSVSRRSLNF